MALTEAGKADRREIRDLAEGIQLKEVVLDEYADAAFVPEKIRQPRAFHRIEPGMQAIARFLIERGTVEILKPPQTLSLFTEMHWCAHQVRRLAAKRFTTDQKCREAVMESRSLVSEMEAAEEELFVANRRLVVRCIKPFFWVGQVWLPDFLQEGSRALSNAIRKFDFTRGTPFYAYAQRAIQNRLRNFFRDHARTGSIAVRPTADMMKLKEALESWRETHGAEEPDNETLARLAGIERSRIGQIKNFLQQWERVPSPAVSLDAVLGDHDTNLHDLIADADADKAWEMAQLGEVWTAIEQLPERSRRIMRLRFVEGRTLEETGREINLTRARIKQIQDESIRAIRNLLRPPGE